MKAYAYLITTGALFGLVGVAHFGRLFVERHTLSDVGMAVWAWRPAGVVVRPLNFTVRCLMVRGVLGILAALLPIAASADCTVDPTRMKPTLSAHALTLRNALFQQACESANGAFIDSTDPTLGARLEQPRGLAIRNSSEYYPPLARRQLVQGTVRLAFVVNTDGSVTQVTVLESSGSDVLDAAALKLWSEARFAVPAKLDGRPIPALGYSNVPFTLR